MPTTHTLPSPPPEPLLAALVQHYDELVGSLRHRFGDECQPREIVNDLCVRLLERPVPQTIGNPLALLRCIARDLAIDRYRAQARRPETAMDGLELDWQAPTAALRLSPPELAVAAGQRQRALLAAIEGLPQASREAFILTKLYGMPQDEAARRLGISRGMVARHVARALQGVAPVLAADHAA